VGQRRDLIQQRREQIEALIRSEGEAQVSALADRFGVSPLTIRRDLDHLESAGSITRRYGVAIARGTEAQYPFEDNIVERAKAAIARRAASLIEDGEQVFVNTSSTATGLIRYIDNKDVTIITNSVAATTTAPSSGITLLVTGGEVRMPRGVLSGEFALNNIRNVNATRCYVGCAGITPEAGATSNTLQEALVNSAMLEHSTLKVILADSTKLCEQAGFGYARADQLDLLITDKWAPAEVLDALREAGLRNIIVVDPDKE
jgi:DeoR/GlpR family transcriptional regulator of sugar metabolism